MPTLPSATTSVQDQAGAAATGLDVVCIFTPCAASADYVPRQLGSAAAVYAQHGYCEGVEYAALHAEKTRKPFLVCGLPIVTAGVISRVDDTGGTGSSAVSVAAGSDGVLGEHAGVVKVDHPAGVTVTIGTDQVRLSYSLDGGRTFKPYRLGTSTSFPLPYVNATVSFAAGTLKGGETVISWFGSAPRSDSAGWALARAALAAQQKGFRSIVLCGDVQDGTEANAFNTQLDAYETANERFIYGRASVRDLYPLPANSTTGGDLTFSEVTDTITRASGSWFVDGFAVGQTVDVEGTDGGTNDGSFEITALTALVMTLDTGDVVAAETSPSDQVTVTTSQTKGAWMSEVDAAFAAVDAHFRISLSAGRGRILSPFSGWYSRRPAGWAASLREYQHDLHRTTWRKSDGPSGFDLFDAAGNLVEWDDRVDGEAACAARFTALRTWANGPLGSFIALSLTRATEGSLLAHTSNVAVVNLVCTTVQLNTENAAIGVDLDLNPDGTATPDSLAMISKQVNNALSQAVLVNKLGEGKRASLCKWTPDATTLFNVASPVMTGVTKLLLKGIVHSVTTSVVVQTAA